MPELKTKVNAANVTEFLDSLPDEVKRKDSHVILEMLQHATKTEPKLWGSSIVGFGAYHYVGKSGREGDWPLAGFSPRKQTLTLYLLGGWEHPAAWLAKLGQHALGQGCLSVKRLEDGNLPSLKSVMAGAVKHAKQLAPAEAKKQAPPKK